MIPVNLEQVRSERIRLVESGRAGAEARLRDWCAKHPAVPCTRCAGRGCYVERAGERRPYDHRDFDDDKGDRYEASCPACKGFGKVTITPAAYRKRKARALAAQRARYGAIRSAVCADREITERAFDGLVARRLGTDRGAGAWLAAAEKLASDFGTVIPTPSRT